MTNEVEEEVENNEIIEEQNQELEDKSPEDKEAAWKSKNQRRIDKLIAKGYEKDSAISALEAKLETVIQYQQPQTQTNTKPNPDSFETTEEFTEALADWKVDQKLTAYEAKQAKVAKQSQAKRSEEDVLDRAKGNIRETSKKYKDFNDVTQYLDIPQNSELGVEVINSDYVGDVMYFLGKNPDEEDRLKELTGRALTKEIGKIEDRLSKPIQKQKTKAPDPITANRSAKVAKTVQSDLKKSSGDQFYNDFNKRIFG